MKPIAPGTVIFHRHRGYGVLTMVNLLTGWVAARFGDENRTIDLNLSTDEVQHADGEAILFRRAPPARMPHARLMAMVRALHAAGYEKLYLYSWPKPSGLHWRWQLFTGPRNWLHRPCREGWYGSGAEYIFNPVMGWGDAPGASTEELIHALAQFDPAGLANALGRDEDHTAWFAAVCDALLPNYAYSLGADAHAHSDPRVQNQTYSQTQTLPAHLPIISVRTGAVEWQQQSLALPPGWEKMWGADALHGRYLSRAVVRHDVIPTSFNLHLDL